MRDAEMSPNSLLVKREMPSKRTRGQVLATSTVYYSRTYACLLRRVARMALLLMCLTKSTAVFLLARDRSSLRHRRPGVHVPADPISFTMHELGSSSLVDVFTSGKFGAISRESWHTLNTAPRGYWACTTEARCQAQWIR